MLKNGIYDTCIRCVKKLPKWYFIILYSTQTTVVRRNINIYNIMSCLKDMSIFYVWFELEFKNFILFLFYCMYNCINTNMFFFHVLCYFSSCRNKTIIAIFFPTSHTNNFRFIDYAWLVFLWLLKTFICILRNNDSNMNSTIMQ